MRNLITTFCALLCAGPITAQALERPRTLNEVAAPTKALFQSQRFSLGLNERHDLAPRTSYAVGEDQVVVQFQQTYRGLKIWGGGSVVLTNTTGTPLEAPVHNLRAVEALNLEPALSPGEAVARVLSHLEAEKHHGDTLRGTKPSFLKDPATELLLYPILRKERRPEAAHKAESDLVAEDFADRVERVALAYHVQIRQRHAGSQQSWDAMIDAQTGDLLLLWDSLQRSDAKATGKTLYSGDVTLSVNYTGSVYEMRDMVRATNPSFNVAPNGSSAVYTSSTAVFGNNTTSDPKSAAADVLWGTQASYDCLWNVMGWKGVDNANAGLNLRVHLQEENAYFDGGNTLTFGDGGSYLKTLTEIDVVAHEYGHAVCQASAGLIYNGESGGLNEGNSDIQGTFVEFYAAGGKTGSVIPSSGGDWVLGAKISRTGNPLRYMYKPSKDGNSPDVWSSSIGSLDVHYSSGPINRMFYFLSQGSTTSGDTASTKLTYGPMTGIGIHKAATIWFKALTTKFTPSTNYAGSYSGCKAVAEQLYGAGSPEAIATTRAFAAIGVTSDIPEFTVAVSPATVTIQAGATYQFTASVTGSSNKAVTWTATGGSVTTSGFYTAPTTPGTYYVRATSVADTAKYGEAKVIVTEIPKPTVTVTPSTATVTTGKTFQFAASVTNSASTEVTWTTTGGVVSPSGLYTAPTTKGVYKVRAALTANPATFGESTVTVTDAPAPTVVLTPLTATVPTGGTFQFTASAKDTTSPNVTWTATAGSISATGLYTAPSTPGSYVVRATSVSAPEAFAEAKVTVTPVVIGKELVLNGGFESGATNWSGITGVIGAWAPYQSAFEGTKCAWFGGNGYSSNEYLFQQVTIPATATRATLSYALRIQTAETAAYDKDTFTVYLSSAAGQPVLGTYSNRHAAAGYIVRTHDLSAYRGKTLWICFNSQEDSSNQTSFLLDKVSLQIQ